MINKKALIIAAIYCVLTISFRLYMLLGNHYITRFGFYYTYVLTVLAIIPFYIIAIIWVRRKDYNGIIRGKDAMKTALIVFSIGLIVSAIYNYVEFKIYGSQLAQTYYNSEDFLNFLKSKKEVPPADYSKIISEQIALASISAFKATTAKVFSFCLLGISSAFFCAFALKKP
ncbi:MAG: DUF4199 family protein [Bacteroidetes bacterium]|nr:DUF4199 family protein [Bacteroidota bacterium]